MYISGLEFRKISFLAKMYPIAVNENANIARVHPIQI